MKSSSVKIMGILNVTDDSFSDGGKYLEFQKAVERGEEMIAQGADIIDIGAVSSNPAAMAVDFDTEIQRLEPLIAHFKKQPIKISIDSFNPQVQNAVAHFGVDYINDIQAFQDESNFPLFLQQKTKLIAMHSVQRNTIADKRLTDTEHLIEEIISFLQGKKKQFLDAGLHPNQIILDPGMGFFLGRNIDASLKVLASLKKIKEELNSPILIGISKKSFLRTIAKKPIEEIATTNLTAEIVAILQGVDIIRTHNVTLLADTIRFLDALSAIK